VYLQELVNIEAKNDLEREQMKNVSYVSVVGSLMYAQVCTRPNISRLEFWKDIRVIQVLTTINLQTR